MILFVMVKILFRYSVLCILIELNNQIYVGKYVDYCYKLYK